MSVFVLYDSAAGTIEIVSKLKIDWLIDKCLTAYQQRGHLRPNKVKTCWGLKAWSVKRIKIKNWIRVKNKYVNKIQDKSSKVKGESFKGDDIREFHERNSVSQ